jgi:hypothetical protein
MKYLTIIGFVGASCILANLPANAGGLFENVPGDLGKVGREFSKVVTPPLQKAVEAEAAKTGCSIGGYYGGPAGCVAGGIAGQQVGHRFNECVAGQCPIGHARPADPPPSTQAPPPPPNAAYNAPRVMPAYPPPPNAAYNAPRVMPAYPPPQQGYARAPW